MFSQPAGLQIDILDRLEGLKGLLGPQHNAVYALAALSQSNIARLASLPIVAGKKASVKRERDGAEKQPKAKKEKTEWDVIHVAARDNMHSELRVFLPNKEDNAKQEWQEWIDENPKVGVLLKQ